MGAAPTAARPVSEELLALATSVAREAGAQLLDYFGDVERRQISRKSTPTDLVSEADVATEALIRERLTAARPDDAIKGEEDEDLAGTSGLQWVVDPLDGTVNFLFGIPQWSVSIAVEDEQGGVAGVVYDAPRGELWAATREGDATLDGVPVTGSPRENLATALVATGFGYDAEVRAVQAEVVARMLPRVRDIRRLGSAALDLAWVAAGRYDAYFEHGVKHWDIAAGRLICARAGLEVRTLPATGAVPEGILVASPGLVDQVGALL